MILLRIVTTIIVRTCLATCFQSLEKRTAMDDSDDPQFIGYFLDGPATERLTLSSGTSWSSSSTIAGECSTSPCVLAVDCTNNILTMANNNKRTWYGCLERPADLQLTD
ncbi:hypothetical protein VD0004_g858 [Verticillium dahliae]|nr:hypothetical protein VD0004_g858 [Verticillium dahliae]PNH75307.1 hypothetical protein VD0001_g2284 [Verticillium dahliae]